MKKIGFGILVLILLLGAILIFLGYGRFYKERAASRDLILSEFQYLTNSVLAEGSKYSNLPPDLKNQITFGFNKDSITYFVYKTENVIDEYYGIEIGVVDDKVVKMYLHKP